jgi:hypothetical protein
VISTHKIYYKSLSLQGQSYLTHGYIIANNANSPCSSPIPIPIPYPHLPSLEALLLLTLQHSTADLDHRAQSIAEFAFQRTIGNRDVTLSYPNAVVTLNTFWVYFGSRAADNTVLDKELASWLVFF